MISDMVTPAFAADDTAALRTEWALKISVLIPDFVSVDFIHLAMVDDETGLYGRINAINRLNLLSSPLLSFVLSSYALSVVTGHRRGFPEKLGKKNSVIALDGLDCLANCVGWKDTMESHCGQNCDCKN